MTTTTVYQNNVKNIGFAVVTGDPADYSDSYQTHFTFPVEALAGAAAALVDGGRVEPLTGQHLDPEYLEKALRAGWKCWHVSVRLDEQTGKFMGAPEVRRDSLENVAGGETFTLDGQPAWRFRACLLAQTSGLALARAVKVLRVMQTK